MKEYKERIVDKILSRKLAGKGAVLIEGPKWCGKTTTAEQQAKSVLYVDSPKNLQQNLFLAETNPAELLTGDSPRLIDEWQRAPQLWDAVRFAVDHEGRPGLFILTGSAAPVPTDKISHTGVGRFAVVRMRTMSLFESGESTGEVSLVNLFEGKASEVGGRNSLALSDIAFLICRGGWPWAVQFDGDIALDQARDYYDVVVKSDISKVDGVKKAFVRVKQLMRSYARNQGSPAALTTICQDMKNALSVPTVQSYLDALNAMFVVEDMPAWNPNLRSKSAIRTSDTRYFTDPSIAAAALGLGPGDLLHDLHTFGLLFEVLAVRDLRVFADALDGEVYHFRDRTGLECDMVLHLRNGAYGLIEVKLGGEALIEEGCKTLKKLEEKIDTDKMEPPSFMMVLTAVGERPYCRPDGIVVVPIGCLRD